MSVGLNRAPWLGTGIPTKVGLSARRLEARESSAGGWDAAA